MKTRTILLSLILSTSLIACGGSGNGASPTAANPAAVVSVADSGETTFNSTALSDTLATYSLGELNTEEEAGLLLMREEEKLAGDVYSALYDLHSLNVFNNISNSEATHTAAVLALLDRYSLEDPVGSNATGEFTNIDLQMLYDQLVASGTPSLLDALYVGAKIEELDIADIERLKTEVVDNDDIIMIYDALLKGSRNHMRAFNKQIIANGGSYTPEYITQEEYDSIVNSDMERG